MQIPSFVDIFSGEIDNKQISSCKGPEAGVEFPPWRTNEEERPAWELGWEGRERGSESLGADPVSLPRLWWGGGYGGQWKWLRR